MGVNIYMRIKGWCECMYTVCKVKIWNIVKLLQVSNILYKCGKDMAEKYNLHHWNNSHIKNWVIVALCVTKNQIYLVYDKKVPVATFQTRKIGQSFLFQKLATSPRVMGMGIGSFCLKEIECLAMQQNCKEILCEVYDRSEHAKRFYEHKGYSVYGEMATLKYKELKFKKEL